MKSDLEIKANNAIEDAADGPRYKAIGNSMAVTVMRWIGERIADAAETHVASHRATITTNNGKCPQWT